MQRLLLPLVAFAAGSLIGGAFFHMIPAALDAGHSGVMTGLAIVAGFTVFFILEQLLHWRHCHQAAQGAGSDSRKPLTTSATGVR